MSLLTRPASTTYASLIYITLGALTVVWSSVWLWYLKANPPHAPYVPFFGYGFLLTGLVILGIGLAVGQIGRAARSAEIPPDEITPAVAAADKTAATNPELRAPVLSTTSTTAPVRVAPVVAPNPTGQPVHAPRV